MDNILFSVLVSFYKDTKDFIKETLDSLANQSNFDLNRLEVVVVDDGSGLDISELVNSYKNKIKNIVYIVKEHGDRGSVYEFAKANKLLHGKYFSILDSDDKWASNMLSTVNSYLKDDPDMITTNIYRWYPTKNRKIKTPVILIGRTQQFDLTTSKRKHLAETPFSWPIGKFYKLDFFYNINFEEKYINDKDSGKSEILFHLCPDVVLYYEILRKAKKWIHITKCLSFARVDRPDSFSNQPWSPSKVRTWAKTINYLTSIGAGCHAIFYGIYHNFYKAYIDFSKQTNLPQLTFVKNLKITYLPKIIHPCAKVVLKGKIKRIGKKVPIKWI